MKPNEMSRMEFLFVLSACLLATGCTTMDLATQKHADGLYRAGELKGAISEYRDLASRDSRYPNALRDLGDALMDAGDLDGAIETYRKFVQTFPADPVAHNSLGNALYKRGNLDGAIAAYREAVKLTKNPYDDEEYARTHNNHVCDPNVSISHTNLGRALLKKGDLEGALTEFKEAVRPTGPVEPYFGIATVLQKKGDLQGTLQYLEEAGEGHAPIRECAEYTRTSYCMGHASPEPGPSRFDIKPRGTWFRRSVTHAIACPGILCALANRSVTFPGLFEILERALEVSLLLQDCRDSKIRLNRPCGPYRLFELRQSTFQVSFLQERTPQVSMGN